MTRTLDYRVVADPPWCGFFYGIFMTKKRYIARLGFELPNQPRWVEQGQSCELTDLEAEHLLRIGYIKALTSKEKPRRREEVGHA